MSDKMREGFDRWAADKWPWAWFRDAAWEGWQAALAEQPAQGEAYGWAVQLSSRWDFAYGTKHPCPDAENAHAWTPLYTATPAPSVPEQRSMIAMVDAAMVEMANIHPPLKRSECERLIRAAMLASGGKASAPGWKLVPAEPTHAMVQAGAKLVKNNFPIHTGTLAIYKTMIAAAPEVPR